MNNAIEVVIPGKPGQASVLATRQALLDSMGDERPKTGQIGRGCVVFIEFHFKRPDSHFASSGELTPKAPKLKTGGDAITSLIEHSLNAHEGTLWSRKEGVIGVSAHKLWSEQDFTRIKVQYV